MAIAFVGESQNIRACILNVLQGEIQRVERLLNQLSYNSGYMGAFQIFFFFFSYEETSQQSTHHT